MPGQVHAVFVENTDEGPVIHAGGLGPVTIPARTPSAIWNMGRVILLTSPMIEQICDFRTSVKSVVSRNTDSGELVLDIVAKDGQEWSYRVIPAVNTNDTGDTRLYFLGVLSEGEPTA